MTAPVSPVAPVIPPLPNWKDPASIAAWLMSVIAVVISVVALLHPGFAEPAVVMALVPIVAVLIAGVVQAVNVITHRGVQKAAFAYARVVAVAKSGMTAQQVAAFEAGLAKR